MAPQYQKRLSAIQRTVLSVGGVTPDERRSRLLASSSGPSLFQQLVDQVTSGPVLRANPMAARDQF
jgi:hypothetical protein